MEGYWIRNLGVFWTNEFPVASDSIEFNGPFHFALSLFLTDAYCVTNQL